MPMKTEEEEPLRRESSDAEPETDNFTQDWKAEQGEALLQNGDADVSPKKEPSWLKAKASRVYSFGFIGVLLLIFSYLIYLLAVHGPCLYGMSSHQCPVSSTKTSVAAVKPTSFRRPQSDYILDPHWNFKAKPKTRNYHFTIKDEEVNPDGVYRQMILINGQFPGPLIECNDGDRLVIEIENQSINATAFHWHGIFQNGSNWMDGTVGVTQCPIAPGRNFTYDFTIRGQHGTYWYGFHILNTRAKKAACTT
jgi:hypothetical protein